jgi:hypothetical protein
MANADSGIDPRYAAQFQRGFDPARHSAVPPLAPTGPRRIDSGPPPVVRVVPPAPAVVERPVAPPVAAEADPPAAELDEPAPSRPRTEWAVLVVGVALLGLAAVLFWGAVEASVRYQGPGPGFEQQFYALAIGTLPGPLLVGGVLAVCLWIALRAVRPPGATR